MSSRRRTHAWMVALGLTLLSGVPGTAGAQSAARTPEQTTYEDKQIARILHDENLERAREPEGKTITFIRIVREEVFLENEGPMSWMQWANALHRTTQERIIRRELLLDEGEPYRTRRARETMRNLRELGILTYARVVPVRRERNDALGVLVYTRDLWSLRLEGSFQVTGNQIDRLFLQGTERNVYGLDKDLALRFDLEPDVYTIGGLFFARRLGDTRLSLLQRGSLVLGRGEHDLEGGAIQTSLRRPFYNIWQRFAFELTASYSTQIERQIRNGKVISYDVPETSQEETIPRIWRDREIRAQARAMMRRGEGYRQTFGVAWDVRDHSVRPTDDTNLTSRQQASFARDVLPFARREIGPMLTYSLFTPTFYTFENLGTYGQSEPVRSGPRLDVSVRLPLRAFGSSTSSAVFGGQFGYTVAQHDTLVRVSLDARTRLEKGRPVDKRLRARFRGATPVIGFFRFAWRLSWEGRSRDTQRTLVTLGGHNGLRGYISQAFFEPGGSRFRGNFEIRTLPLEVHSVHMGLVLFYDVGTVYDDFDDATLHHGVGIGVRLLFPQFNRRPLRLDVGASVGREEPFGVVPSFGGRQALPLTPLDRGRVLQ